MSFRRLNVEFTAHLGLCCSKRGLSSHQYSSLTTNVAINRSVALAYDRNVDTPFADDETLITCAMSSCSFLSHFPLEEKRADDDDLEGILGDGPRPRLRGHFR